MSVSAPIRFLRPVPEAPGPARRPRAVSPTPVATVGLLDNSKDRVEILLAGLAEGLRAGRPGTAHQRRSTTNWPRQPWFTHTPARFQPQL